MKHTMPSTMKPAGRAAWLGGTLLLGLALGVAGPAAAKGVDYTAYGATIDYNLVAAGSGEHDVPSMGKARQTWRFQDGRYQIRLEAFGGMAVLVAEGSYDAQGLTPASYTYLSSGKVRRRVEFDWAKQQLRLSHDNQLLPLAKNTYDPLSVMVVLGQQLKQGKSVTVQLADGRRVATREYKLEGTPSIPTPQGATPTQHAVTELEGDETGFPALWFARDQQPWPLRLVLVTKSISAEMRAESIQPGSGKP